MRKIITLLAKISGINVYFQHDIDAVKSKADNDFQEKMLPLVEKNAEMRDDLKKLTFKDAGFFEKLATVLKWKTTFEFEEFGNKLRWGEPGGINSSKPNMNPDEKREMDIFEITKGTRFTMEDIEYFMRETGCDIPETKKFFSQVPLRGATIRQVIEAYINNIKLPKF